MTDEVRRWQAISAEKIDEFIDDSGMLNEFALMYALKDQFPLHCTSSPSKYLHTSHTRPTVSRRSRARVTTNLSDPNMRPHYLALLVTFPCEHQQGHVRAFSGGHQGALLYAKFSKGGKVPKEEEEEQ